MRSGIAVTLVLGAAALSSWACGSGEPGSGTTRAGERTPVIDEVAGTYRGVQLGSGPAVMHRELGPREPAGENEPHTPLKGESYGPWTIIYGDEPCPSPAYRYDYAVFGFDCGVLLWIETTEPGAATSGDVAVGDSLALVRPAYPEAACGTAGGGEYEEYPACSVRVAPERYVWFGGDPITTIAIGSVPLDGVEEEERFTGRVLTLEDGEFVTYGPGEASPGDKIVCAIDGKRIEAVIPPPDTGVSVDPMYVATKPDGSVRAECGGIHAETAPPGSW